MRGGSRLTTYEAEEMWYPGHVSSVAAAPPMTSRRSKTRTSMPAFARKVAQASPLCPPPTTTTSCSWFTCRTVLDVARCCAHQHDRRAEGQEGWKPGIRQ